MVVVHFIDVGQGNMTLAEMPDGTIFLYDCNVTDENADRVLGYLRAALSGRRISFFINSHREADHMRGLKRVIREFPIPIICDNGVPGGTTNTTEYNEYMEVRRNARRFTIKHGETNYGTSRLRVLNAASTLLATNPNAQSIVLKVENLNPAMGTIANSVMLTGDADAATWENWIVPVHRAHLPSTILLGGHHGADTFFTKANGDRYVAHIVTIRPTMTVISVGDNPHGHPDPAALRSYEAWSRGADNSGMKIARTDLHGSIRLVLNDDGSWRMTWLGPSPRPASNVLPRRLRTILTGIPPGSTSPRPLPGRRLGTILTGTRSSPPPKPLLSPIFTPSPPPRSPLAELADRLMTPPPKVPSLGDIFGEFLEATQPRKTPAEEFAEWLVKQRLWPPK